jgi:hypothetical protein
LKNLIPLLVGYKTIRLEDSLEDENDRINEVHILSVSQPM